MKKRLLNKTRQLVQFNLPHAHCCTKETCYCTETEMVLSERDRSTGRLVQKFNQRRVCGSVIILARGSVIVDAQQANSPEIIAAQKRGDLVISEVK